MERNGKSEKEKNVGLRGIDFRQFKNELNKRKLEKGMLGVE